MMLTPSRNQWKNWSLPSKITYISFVVTVVGLILWVLSQTWTAKENQEMRTDVKEIKDIVKEMQGVETRLKDYLMSTYQQGYCLFAIEHKEIITPYKSRLIKDYRLDWNSAEIVGITSKEIAFMLPDIYSTSTGSVFQSNIASIRRVVGFTSHVFSFYDLDIYIELLSDTEEGMIFVIGFRIIPMPQNRTVR